MLTSCTVHKMFSIHFTTRMCNITYNVDYESRSPSTLTLFAGITGLQCCYHGLQGVTDKQVEHRLEPLRQPGTMTTHLEIFDIYSIYK